MLKYKYMNMNKIVKIVLEKQPISSSTIITKTHDLLKNKVKNLPFADKKRICNQGYDRALQAAKKNARVEFICAALLFDLARKDETIYPEIVKQLNPDIEKIVRSYEFTRRKLEPSNPDLFQHSYRTAQNLATIKIGTPAICTALLHELPKHKFVSLEELTKLFGKEIAGLTGQFQKIRQIYTANNKQHISHLREMVVAMAQDLRVIIIKMCSNIDRMRNASIVEPDKLNSIAKESQEILAPLADLLGIWNLRWQLEDHSFKIIDPENFKKISQRFNIDERKNREKYIQKTKNLILKSAKTANIKCIIEGRFKHFYSIHQKMTNKNKTFNQISDVFALRVIVDKPEECYQMLGILHRLWKPKQRRFKDYIAAPKNNKYKSLHTTVFGINGRATEFQIRTKEMDEEANFGIAAHWYYKNPRRRVPAWIQEMLLKQQDHQNDEKFLTQFKSDLLENRIYVYSPKGDVISLPAEATPIDFAYHIHSEIGHKCKQAIVNDLMVPMNYKLNTNDIVKIITDRSQAGPNTKWLDFVKTNAAKKHIEDYLNRQPVGRNFRI